MRRLFRVLHAITPNGGGTVGLALVGSAVFLYALLEWLILTGDLGNMTTGMVLYLVVPVVFGAGLAAIGGGLWWSWRRSALSPRRWAASRFGEELLAPATWGSALALITAAGAIASLAFLGGSSARMLHFMEQPAFCGTACHTVMEPEWVAWHGSAHAGVACVECHVGEGIKGLAVSKIHGSWELISVTLDLYERPIPAPVASLPATDETCGRCHVAEADHGVKVVERVRYGLDEASTPTRSQLALDVSPRGVHWHTAHRVRFASVDDAREVVLWAESERADGAVRRFTREGGRGASAEVREMDCVDCHARTGHRFATAEETVDRLLTDGRVDRRLPWIKALALDALQDSWPSEEAAMRGIERELWGSYQRSHPQQLPELGPAIDQAVAALQGAYRQGTFREVGVSWGTHQDLIGHPARGQGCFRCHQEKLVDEAGQPVPFACDTCHTLRAWDAPLASGLVPEGMPSLATSAEPAL
ncbi:MAG: NapC/NirT family cytochrome c [Deltaproteobacteria bacterium]|nr:NapC/NirT family cytochrome c [Deltaproteobacteria bacterium]